MTGNNVDVFSGELMAGSMWCRPKYELYARRKDRESAYEQWFMKDWNALQNAGLNINNARSRGGNGHV